MLDGQTTAMLAKSTDELRFIIPCDDSSASDVFSSAGEALVGAGSSIWYGTRGVECFKQRRRALLCAEESSGRQRRTSTGNAAGAVCLWNATKACRLAYDSDDQTLRERLPSASTAACHTAQSYPLHDSTCPPYHSPFAVKELSVLIPQSKTSIAPCATH